MSRYSNYSYGFRLFDLVVFAMLQMIEELSVPWMVSMISRFFLPIQKPWVARSLALLSIETSPSSRNTRRYFSCFSVYSRVSCSFPACGTLTVLMLEQNRIDEVVLRKCLQIEEM